MNAKDTNEQESGSENEEIVAKKKSSEEFKMHTGDTYYLSAGAHLHITKDQIRDLQIGDRLDKGDVHYSNKEPE